MAQFAETEEITMSKDASTMDEVLKSVWDKVRLATHLISQLREEKRAINNRLEELERQMASLRTELQSRDHEIKRLRTEHAQTVNTNGQQSFSEEEKEAIKNRIRDLISKINSYL
jgi:chromosome segregation ATPase